MNPQQVLGKRLRARRHELGLSEDQLAKRSGLHRTYVGGTERSERNIGLINLVRLAHALMMDPGDLLRGLRPADG